MKTWALDISMPTANPVLWHEYTFYFATKVEREQMAKAMPAKSRTAGWNARLPYVSGRRRLRVESVETSLDRFAVLVKRTAKVTR